ncbi:MAG: hypothetical protein WA667_10520 [Candidatus Nitrosopolaris sp.]
MPVLGIKAGSSDTGILFEVLDPDPFTVDAEAVKFLLVSKIESGIRPNLSWIELTMLASSGPFTTTRRPINKTLDGAFISFIPAGTSPYQFGPVIR